MAQSQIFNQGYSQPLGGGGIVVDLLLMALVAATGTTDVVIDLHGIDFQLLASETITVTTTPTSLQNLVETAGTTWDKRFKFMTVRSIATSNVYYNWAGNRAKTVTNGVDANNVPSTTGVNSDLLVTDVYGIIYA